MSEAPPIAEYSITDHARFEMVRRRITAAQVEQVLSGLEQTGPVRPGRVACQSRVQFGEPSRTYLLRVFVDVDRQPPEVVTAYRTSKIDKPWRDEG